MIRLIMISCCFFAWSLQAQGQQFRYSDREIYTAGSRLPVVAAADGEFHIWSFDLYHTKLHTFDADLNFLETKLINISIKAGFRVEFLKFQSFYYAVLSDSVSAKIFRIGKEGSMTDKTDLVVAQLSSKELRPYFFTKGSSNIFLVQKVNDDYHGQTVVNITVFDSSFHYLNKMAINVPYLFNSPQNMELTPTGDQLLLLSSSALIRGDIAFTITKINVETGLLSTKVFHTDKLEFLGQKIFEADGGFILESQVKDSTNGQPGDQFTYFMKLTNELEVTKTLFLTRDASPGVNPKGYSFLPKSTLTLPGKTLLTISVGRKMDRSVAGADQTYRFMWIDSNFHVAHSFMQPSEKGKFAPTLSIMNDNGLHFFYEEEIRYKVSMIHTYHLKGAIVEDEPLLLKANYQYDLSKVVVAGRSSFVMPYYRKDKIGLVRVRM